MANKLNSEMKRIEANRQLYLARNQVMITMTRPVPIFRIFDEVKTREFYLDFLGFTIDFEHRFEDGLPLYMGVSRDKTELHLSEHHGDGVPGARLRVLVNDIEALHAELAAKKYKYARPGIMDQEWGFRELVVGDPFGNQLIFCQSIPE